MSTVNKKTIFNKDNEKLIQEISNHFIEIFKIVKKQSPKNFTNDDIILMFVKTEAVYNSIQVELARKNRKKKRNGNGNGKLSLPKENERTKEFYA